MSKTSRVLASSTSAFLLLTVAGCGHASSGPPLSNAASTKTAWRGDEARPARAGDRFADALASAYERGKAEAGGKNADYIPALAEVDTSLFGIALVTVSGDLYQVGDTLHEFSIQSVSKIFTLARAVELLGTQVVEERIGVNATGLPFNSIQAIELNKETHPAMNPLVNAGAMSTVALLPEASPGDKWSGLIGTYTAFAARPLTVNEPVYKSESETNTRNRSIATLLQAYGVIEGDPSAPLDLYTRQCSVNVSAKDLAVMGATLANGGTNPISRTKVINPEVAAQVLAVMATAGLYETTGQWLYRVGVPAKSGVGGGIVAVVPGKFAIGTFAPPLDRAGNSVRGQAAITAILTRLKVNMFASEPAPRAQAGGAEDARWLARLAKVSP